MDDEPFLRTILASPEDDTPRNIYIDWLEERNDPRADFMRSLKRGSHDAIPPECDPAWLAFVTTLGCPFVVPQPGFDFFDNCPLEDLPFSEQIGRRGRLLTFASQFRDKRLFSSGLLDDLAFLTSLDWGECQYGAASFGMHPFMCELPDKSAPLTDAQVLQLLRPRDFRRHDDPREGTDTVNDEIHNSFQRQFMFEKYDPENDEIPVGETAGTHGLLKAAVEDGALWYAQLHTTPHRHAEFLFSNHVVLFAVGRSIRGNRLIGVVTHQVCHNLCH